MNEVIEKVELATSDRCDKCGARAMVRATLKTGELYFCGHHAKETGYTLVLQALEVYDPEGLLKHEDR
jgi:ssDNA-binding Zn-finger/Zn-ribbon topoisomerase 1